MKTKDNISHFGTITDTCDEKLIDDLIVDIETEHNVSSLSSFITSQDIQSQKFSIHDDEDDPNRPIICSVASTTHHDTSFDPMSITETTPVPAQVDEFTPYSIKESLI